MKKNLSLLSSILLIALISGCGGGGSTPIIKPDGNITKPPKSDNTKEWELSKDITPKFTLVMENEITDFSDVVYDKHPRIYFRDTDVTSLREKMSTAEWTTFKEVLTSSRLPKTKTTQEALDFLLDRSVEEQTEYGRMLTFLAFMERDAYYLDLAKSYAMALANPNRILEESDDDVILRRRMERLAELYDWLHDDFTDAEKKMLRTSMLAHINRLVSFDYMSETTNYIQKHSRWGHGVLSEVLLSMYGDFDEDFTKVYADKMLQDVREELRAYEEAERYISADGGWHLGWGYAYFNADYTFNYLVWSTATKETMLNDWMGNLTSWYLYGLRADKKLPQTGDATVTPMGYGMMAALYQSKFKQDGLAKWYVDEAKKVGFSDMFLRFLLSDESVAATAPDTLPLSRHFESAGTVIARDTWDFDSATLLIFKSSPFYNAGHHHRDENSFTLDYKTSLALDTGFYDQTDSNHYKNYYVRTIAHNAITVFNPNQVMYYETDYNENESQADKVLINDGGQVYKTVDSKSKADIVPGAANRLDGITKYQSNNSYTYTQGDATKAYDPVTVSLAKRDVMYVKDSGHAHPVVIVLDKIEATDGSFQKRYLLHMEAEADNPPVIDTTNNSMRVTSEGTTATAKMTNITLFPANATQTLVGGEGDEYALMPGVAGDTNTTPVETQIVSEIKADKDTKTGNWRLEVSPALGQTYDVMLNVLFVDDENAMDINPIDVQRIGDTTMSGVIGVQLPSRVIVFSKERTTSASPMEYSTRTTGSFSHTVVTGYAKNETVTISVNNVQVLTAIVGDAGCVDFSITVSNSDIIRVAKN